MSRLLVLKTWLLLSGLLMASGCSALNAVIKPATSTATPLPPTATATLTPVPPTATVTSTSAPTLVATASESAAAPEGTQPAVPPAGSVVYPLKFNVVISAPATSCGEAVSSEFTVTLTESTISLYQIEFQLTSTGPYDPSTGAFTATVSGLPGTETYTGVVTLTPGASGTVVALSGQFTYTGDPEWTCTIPDQFSGQATIAP